MKSTPPNTPTHPSQVEEVDPGLEAAGARVTKIGSSLDLEELETKIRQEREDRVVPVDTALEIAKEEERKIIQVLHRGITQHQLDVNKIQYADGNKRLWSRKNLQDINRMEALGCWVDKKQPEDGDTIHPSPDNKVYVGDLIRMATTPERFALIYKVKGSVVKNRRLQSRKDFHKMARENKDNSGRPVPIPTFEG